MKGVATNLSQARFEKLCVEGEVAGAASDDVIRLAQAELNVEFPEEYNDFLKRFGAVVARGVEIYGLPNRSTNDPPLWNNVVAVTLRLREVGQAGAEDRAFVPFSEDGTGVYFFFNTRVSPETEIWAVGLGIHKRIPEKFHELVLALSEGRVSLRGDGGRN